MLTKKAYEKPMIPMSSSAVIAPTSGDPIKDPNGPT